MEYNFKEAEPKWQQKWEEAGVFHAVDNDDRPKFYGLVEFPYPSGAGMHVGHIKAYSGLEVVSRKRRCRGIMSCSRSALTRTVCRPKITPLKPVFIRVRSRT